MDQFSIVLALPEKNLEIALLWNTDQSAYATYDMAHE